MPNVASLEKFYWEQDINCWPYFGWKILDVRKVGGGSRSLPFNSQIIAGLVARLSRIHLSN